MGPRMYMGLFLSMSGLILSLSHLSLGCSVPEGDFEPFTSYGIYLYSFSPPPTTINTITTAAPSSPHLHIIINHNIIVSNIITSMIDPAALESIVNALLNVSFNIWLSFNKYSSNIGCLVRKINFSYIIEVFVNLLLTEIEWDAPIHEWVLPIYE